MYPIFHGITLADNSSIENLVVEQLATDPSAPSAGRVWYNSTSNLFKMAVDNGSGTVEVKTFGTQEELTAFIASLAAATGASLVGYEGKAGVNAQLTVAQGTVKASIDALVDAVDADRQSEADERAALASTATGGSKVGVAAESGINAEFSTDAGTLQETISALVDGIDAEITARKALESASTNEYLNKVTLDPQSVVGATTFQNSVTIQGNLMVGGNTVTTLSEIVEIHDNKIVLNSDLTGASLIVNGEFDANTDWTLGAGWSISGGLATIDGSQSADSVLSQSFNAVDQQVYEASFKVSGYTAGSVRMLVGGVEVIAAKTADGTYKAQFTATATGASTAEVIADPDFAGSVDSVAVKPVYAPTEDTGVQVNRGVDGILDLIMFDESSDRVLVPVWDGSQFNMEEVGSKPYIDSVDTAIRASIDQVEASVGLGTDGSLTIAGTNYIDGQTSILNALKALDTQMKEGGSDAIDALQAELDATQAGAGLGTDGGYVANATANYISAATSLKDADDKLDVQVKVNTDAIANEVAARQAAVSGEATARQDADALIQAELDATQTGAGLGADGVYSAKGDANYIAAATSLKSADNLLDAALKQEETDRVAAVSAEATARAAQDDVIEASVGLEADGSLAIAGTNYINGQTSVVNALKALDTQMKEGGSDAINALQAELDATQTGSGLGEDGAYVAVGAFDGTSNPTGAHYIGAATSLKDADMKLDAQVKANADAVAAEAVAREAQDDVIEASVGLETDGSLAAFTGANYVAADTTIRSAVVTLDTALKSEEAARQTAGNNIVSAVNAQRFTYKSSTPALSHNLQHDLGTEFINVTVLVKGDDGLYRNDYVLVTEVDSNNLTITMTESRDIKVVIQAMDAIAPSV